MPPTETTTMLAPTLPRLSSSWDSKTRSFPGNHGTIRAQLFHRGPLDLMALYRQKEEEEAGGAENRPRTSPSHDSDARSRSPPTPSPPPPLPQKNVRRLLRRPQSHASLGGGSGGGGDGGGGGGGSSMGKKEERKEEMKKEELSLSTIPSCGELQVTPNTVTQERAPAEQKQPITGRELLEFPTARFQRRELDGDGKFHLFPRDTTVRTGTTYHRAEGDRTTSKRPDSDEIARVDAAAGRVSAAQDSDSDNGGGNGGGSNANSSSSSSSSHTDSANADIKNKGPGSTIRTFRPRPLAPTVLPSPVSSSPASKSTNPNSRTPALGLLSFLARGRRSNAATLSPSSSMRTSTDISTSSSLDAASPSRLFIEPGGKGIVPQIDAPVSASNGGEREISVRCGEATLNLTVTNETNAADLIRSCAVESETAVNATASTIVEAYRQLGLERRLRPYERIRDVLGSWDPDSQNRLVVQPASAGSPQRLGSPGALPPIDEQQPPRGFALLLHHSNSPGRWRKRYISLQENGQVLSSKKADHAQSSKDTTTLCHLSDFDIYKPTGSRVKNNLHPPRKYCYAVKSQQKPAVFVNTDSFVHFFSTDDPDVAHTFYSLIHDWRSWYLATKLSRAEKQAAAGKKKDSGGPHTPAKESRPKTATGSQNKARGASADESPYPIGTFEPLLDLKRFDKPLDEFGKDGAPLDGSRPASTLISRMAKAELEAGGGAGGTGGGDRSEAFGAGTLLGQGYEKRKQAQREREIEEKKRSRGASDVSGPFTEGRSLLNNSSSGSTSWSTVSDSLSSTPRPSAEKDKADGRGWFPSAVEHSAQQRGGPAVQKNQQPTPLLSGGPSHQREKQHHHQTQQRGSAPSPLVDLGTSKAQQPPQWSRQRPGRGVRAPQGVMLVDLATSSGDPNNSGSSSSVINRFPAPPGMDLSGRRQGVGGPPRDRDTERARAGSGGNSNGESSRSRGPTHPVPLLSSITRNGSVGPNLTRPNARDGRQLPRDGGGSSRGMRKGDEPATQKGYDARLKVRQASGGS